MSIELAVHPVPGAEVIEGSVDGHDFIAVFTRKAGPFSGTLGGTNLSRTVGDDPDAVRSARAWAADTVGLDAARVVWGRQIHGAGVAYATELLALRGPDGPAVPDTDALVTDLADVGVGVLVADCVPTLIAGPGAVAVIHSGWRGLRAGVVARGIEALRELPGQSDAELAAVVGPSIGVCCYEVGTEVAEQFAEVPDMIVRGAAPRPHLDLRRGVAHALEAEGVVSIRPLFPCTRCHDDHWSHRRGERGRQALVARVRARGR